MRNWILGVTVGIAAAAAAVGAYAQQQRAGKPLTPQDYIEIQQLYMRYTWAIDSHAEDGMAYARTFTPDGEFLIRGVRNVGYAALAEIAKAKPNGAKPAPHHYTTNLLIEPSPEGARGQAYYMSVPTPEPGKPVSIITTGTYRDVLVRTPDGWRFKSRIFYTDEMPPASWN
jgi:hypothetical protein